MHTFRPFLSVLSALMDLSVQSIPLSHCAPICICYNDLHSSSKILSSPVSNSLLNLSTQLLVFEIILFSCRISICFVGFWFGLVLVFTMCQGSCHVLSIL